MRGDDTDRLPRARGPLLLAAAGAGCALVAVLLVTPASQAPTDQDTDHRFVALAGVPAGQEGAAISAAHAWCELAGTDLNVTDHTEAFAPVSPTNGVAALKRAAISVYCPQLDRLLPSIT